MKTNRMVRTVRATAIILAVSVGAAWMQDSEAQDSDCYERYGPAHKTTGALHKSVAKGSTEVVEKLLNAGANPNSVNHRGWTSLHVATSAGHLDLVEALLNAGASVDAIPTKAPEDWSFRKCAGVTSLHLAAWKGHTDIVDALLAAGADANAAANGGHTPMSLADHAGHVDIVISLLNAGATHQ